MSEHGTNTDTVRADGPVIVREGPDHGPVVVVLDPAGDAKHDQLPATWRPLAGEVGVVWLRLPAARRDHVTGDRLLAQVTDGRDRVHLVGATTAALLTLSLAVGHRQRVRSVVLVDPPWAQEDLAALRRIVNEPELALYQLRTDRSGPTTDRLPIGHPAVVDAVLRTLGWAGVG